MTCQELVDFLMAYLDGELPEDQHSTFETHVGICPPCKAYLDTYQETIRLGRLVCAEGAETPAQVPDELVQAILDARARG